tara:strand:+ start:398 stop:688 length:291 start_codon:yes stop_codon:yes gene_type:complete
VIKKKLTPKQRLDVYKKIARKKNDETFKKVKEIAKEKGGVCLSKRYTKSTDKLKFRCALGHEWQTRSIRITSGRWCTFCAKKKGWETRKKIEHGKN